MLFRSNSIKSYAGGEEYINKNCCNLLEEENEMDFRGCGLDIYKYNRKYIFFGDLIMYIEMYKGMSPGVFSEPILAIKEDCSIEEMSEAILKSIEILHENKDKIAEESNRIKYGDLLSLRFKKLNKVGIRASKKKVIEGGSIDRDRKSVV